MMKMLTQGSTSGAIFVLALVIASGLYLGRFKVKGVSLGSTWILFVGILLGHFGLRINPTMLSFVKDFGLILFVFAIGLQVGPGFFRSFRKDGITMNLMAIALVALAVITTFVIHLVTGEDLAIMTGVMSGAVTNTPGLGAAQQIRRFKASRRLHPLAKSGRIEDGIRQEREYLRKLKDWSDYVVDTSDMLTRQLQEEMSRLFDTDAQEGDMFITIMSFGYKYGIPSDADLVFDVRFLPNPFYVEDLKHKTGNDKEVMDYVCQTGEADEFLRRVEELLDYLIPKYKAEGKRQLMVCVGCTGGRHRSVTMANKLADYYEQQPLAACLLHRDIAIA